MADQLGTPTGVLHQMYASGAWREVLRWTLAFPGLSLRDRLSRFAYGLGGLAPTSIRKVWSERSRTLPPWLSKLARERGRLPAARPWDLEFVSAVQRRHWEELTSAQMEFSLDYIQRHAAQHGVEVCFPFLDRDLVTFVLKIPFQNWPRPEGSERLQRRALADILPFGVSRRKDKAEFSDAFARRVKNASPVIDDLLEHGSWISEPYVERSAARELVQRARRRGASASEGVSAWRVATVEAWLRAVLSYPTAPGEIHG